MRRYEEYVWSLCYLRFASDRRWLGRIGEVTTRRRDSSRCCGSEVELIATDPRVAKAATVTLDGTAQVRQLSEDVANPIPIHDPICGQFLFVHYYYPCR